MVLGRDYFFVDEDVCTYLYLYGFEKRQPITIDSNGPSLLLDYNCYSTTDVIKHINNNYSYKKDAIWDLLRVNEGK